MTQFLFSRRSCRVGLCGFLAVLFTCLAAGSASARPSLDAKPALVAAVSPSRSALLTASPATPTTITSACGSATVTEAFLPWGDGNLYELVPGGSFEGSLSGWTLTGGAKTVSGSSAYGATGTVGSGSFSLPAGASAQSPFLCVTANDSLFRFLRAQQHGRVDHHGAGRLHHGSGKAGRTDGRNRHW